MSTPTKPDRPKSRNEQREALMESERKASERQPENFKDEAVTDKKVEIGPITKDGSAIKGLDPK